jgi:hypothetical protein
MKNRWLLNLALVLLIAGLALVVWYKPGREQAARPPLTGLAPDTIREIRVERREREAVVLARTDGAWRLAAPVKARANRHNVDGLLRLLAAPSEARLAADSDLKPFGLDPPQSTVHFDNEVIALGHLHPLRNQVYARYQGTVHLIPAHHQAAAGYPYSQFLDSRLLDDGDKPVAFRLPGFALTLKDGSWRREPALAALSSDRVNDFVREWQHASALNVERAARTAPLASVEITVERQGQPVKLVLGVIARKPEFVLRRHDEGLEYHFPEESGQRLLNLGEK